MTPYRLWAALHPLLSAVFIGIGGHMGSRGIFFLENWVKANFPGKPPVSDRQEP